MAQENFVHQVFSTKQPIRFHCFQICRNKRRFRKKHRYRFTQHRRKYIMERIISWIYRETSMKTLIAVSSLMAALASSGQAATLVAFQGVAGASVPASIEAAGVTGFDLNRSIGVIANAGGTFNSRDWEEGTDKLSALSNNNAIFWGLTIGAGSAYDLTSFEIDYDRSATGPNSIAIDLFIDNVNQGEVFSDNAVLNSGAQSALVDLSAFQNVTGSVFFRLSGWGATSSAGTFDIENDLAGGYGIIVSGNPIAAVPLPAGMPLLLAGIGGLAALRSRRKSA